MTARRLFHGPRGWHATPDQDYPAQLKRVFLDTAPGIWQSPAEIEFACTVLGVDQIMLGSDYPLSNDPASIIRNSVRTMWRSFRSNMARRRKFLATMQSVASAFRAFTVRGRYRPASRPGG